VVVQLISQYWYLILMMWLISGIVAAATVCGSDIKEDQEPMTWSQFSLFSLFGLLSIAAVFFAGRFGNGFGSPRRF
jgi:hypothetical protein